MHSHIPANEQPASEYSISVIGNLWLTSRSIYLLLREALRKINVGEDYSEIAFKISLEYIIDKNPYSTRCCVIYYKMLCDNMKDPLYRTLTFFVVK